MRSQLGIFYVNAVVWIVVILEPKVCLCAADPGRFIYESCGGGHLCQCLPYVPVKKMSVYSASIPAVYMIA